MTLIATLISKIKALAHKIAHLDIVAELAHGVGYGLLVTHAVAHEIVYASFAVTAIALVIWISTHD